MPTAPNTRQDEPGRHPRNRFGGPAGEAARPAAPRALAKERAADLLDRLKEGGRRAAVFFDGRHFPAAH